MKIHIVGVDLFNADVRTDGRTDGRTDRYDKANSLFLQLSERASAHIRHALRTSYLQLTHIVTLLPAVISQDCILPTVCCGYSKQQIFPHILLEELFCSGWALCSLCGTNRIFARNKEEFLFSDS